MKQKLLLLFALVMSSMGAWAEKEAYVALETNSDNVTLEFSKYEYGGDPEYPIHYEATKDYAGYTMTFYYDENKASHTKTYALNSGSSNPQWSGASFSDTATDTHSSADFDVSVYYRKLITQVVFDASFADYHPTTCYYWFCNFNELTNISGIANLKTDLVTNMGSMFESCIKLPSIDVSGFNTSNVTNMRGMFDGLILITSLDVSNFDTSNVTNMGSMFRALRKITSLNLSNLDTRKVTDMSYMFGICDLLESITFGSNFKTDNVTTMSVMFYGCQALESIDLSQFNTAKVTTMQSMFNDCKALTTLDVSKFDTSNVTDFWSMFYGCSNLTSLDVTNFNTEKATTMQSMFNRCSKITSLDLSNFNTAKVTYMWGMFYNCSLLQTIKISNEWNTDAITSDYYGQNIFYNCTSIVGEDGTTYNSSNTDKNYAHSNAGGYLTLTKAKANEVGTEYWSTFYKTLSNYEVDANTTVYTATQSGTTLTLHEVGNRIIKAGEGVILKSTNPSISLTKTATEPTSGAYDGNVLKGVNAATAQTSGTTYYVLGYKDSHLAFYKYKSDQILGAHKAYIPVTSDPSREYIDINIDGLSTGISVVEDVKGKMDGVFYDLSGRRVLYPTKGLYIVNGKKVIIK